MHVIFMIKRPGPDDRSCIAKHHGKRICMSHIRQPLHESLRRKDDHAEETEMNNQRYAENCLASYFARR